MAEDIPQNPPKCQGKSRRARTLTTIREALTRSARSQMVSSTGGVSRPPELRTFMMIGRRQKGERAARDLAKAAISRVEKLSQSLGTFYRGTSRDSR
eukprot:scaffold1340_cov253-Pinguiococcus_pyrenoidosus.AAC.42